MAKLKLGVIFGGMSREHEVSVNSARMIIKALNRKKYDVVPIAISKKGHWLFGRKAQKYFDVAKKACREEGGINSSHLEKVGVDEEDYEGFVNLKKEDFDVILPIGHGSYMEDGKLQGMLDMLNIPYVFSGVSGSALAMNKYKAKLIAKDAGLDILEGRLLYKDEQFNVSEIVSYLELPLVIKPNELGSSVGITVAKDKKQVSEGIKEAFELGNGVLVERYCKGRELTVSVFGNNPSEALPVVEIIPKVSDWFDYKAKYTKGGSGEICPAEIPTKIKNKVQKGAIRIFEALECSDLARADFIWSEKQNKVYFFEINSIPGMTATSLSPQAAKETRMEFGVFLDRLIEEALGK